jgi:hypothetical protein
VIFADTENGPGSFEETPRRLGVAGLATGLCLTALLLWAPAALAATNNIFTVAGVGTSGFSGDGGPAISAQLFAPAGVAATADDGVLIADTFNNRVRRVSPAGTITTVAGNGTQGSGGDGGPATGAELARPFGVAATADGGFLIADTFNSRVRRVSPAGTITTVAGGGTAGLGDGGPATNAELFNPIAVAVTADGGFLIADTDNNLVRRVSPAGTITTVAGASPGGFSGDGGPATAAQLNQPEGVTTTADGGFLIADSNNSRVRRVSPAGTITTVAGTGTVGFSGDGGPAIAAQLFGPAGVVATSDGGFLIADSLNNRVRRVSLAGRITTVAGDGTEGFSGDSGLATAAQLQEPLGVAATADGGFLIADVLNHRVRFVDADLGIPQGPPPPSDATCLGRPVTIVAAAGAGLTRGTPGNDVIVGSRKRADRISSGGGRDLVCARGGNDVVNTGAGADRVAAGSGADRVSTGAGADTVNPGSGRDRVRTGPGNDRLRLAGGTRDRADCGPGRDRVRRDGADRLRRCERVRRS